MAAKKPKKSYYQICSVCGQEKTQAEFYKDGTGKNGPRYRKECKACYTKRRKDRELEKTLPGVIEMTPVRKVE